MSELYQLPNGWEWKQLTDVVRIGCERGFTPSVVDGKVPFIGMSDIDEIRGRDTNYIWEDFSKVSKGKTKFQKNSVLVGKITPCTQNNKTTIVPSEIDGGYATTEVYALHTMDMTDPLYLNYYIRSNRINDYLVSTMIGATGRQRVPSDTLQSLQIPLPPLSEQQRIVSKLDKLFEKIDKAIALHQKNIEEADVFLGSILNDVFGELEESYGSVSVGEVTDCIVPQRNKPKQFIGDIQWITTDDLQLFKRIAKSTKGLGLRREDIEEVKSKTFPKESVLMSCVGDLGIVAIADDEIVVNQQLHTFQCRDNLINTFLMYALYVKKDFMYQIANLTTVAYMNKAKCNSIPIPLPPLPIQKNVVAYLDELAYKIDKVKAIQKEKMDSLEALKASILDKAFRGEL